MSDAMSQLNPVIARVILVAEDTVAVMRRVKGDQEFVAFPGGHIEDMETPQAAANRELQEEMSVDVTIGPLRYVYVSKKWGIQYFFAANLHAQIPLRLQEKSEEYRDTQAGGNTYSPVWMSLDELTSENALPQLVVDALQRDGLVSAHDLEPGILIEQGED